MKLYALIKPDSNKLRQCPNCRGYSLERQWCFMCKGKGVIKQ